MAGAFVIIPQKFPQKVWSTEQEVAVFLHGQQSNNLSKACQIIELITAKLYDPTTLKKFKARPGDWTRKGNLTFERVVGLILQGHHQSLQNNLNDETQSKISQKENLLGSKMPLLEV